VFEPDGATHCFLHCVASCSAGRPDQFGRSNAGSGLSRQPL
jgi:hypothetical protein